MHDLLAGRLNSPVYAMLLGLLAAGDLSAHAHAEPQHIDVLDPRVLPLGDGRVSAQPKRGYVYSCRPDFHGIGAQHVGEWIHGSVWDANRKITVQGDVRWPSAAFAVATAGSERRIVGNGLPLNHSTGIFPVRSSDPAYRIDRNPNAISTQQISFAVPLQPQLATSPSCVHMGMIGVALNGVAIFNALDAAGRDAVAHEAQDHCNGHPERHGQYHYHGPSDCIAGMSDNSRLLGYALDGFGIYSMYDDNSKELTNVDLDECHGRVSSILWDGRQVNMYHYVLTREYPYTVGCFRGVVSRIAMHADVPSRDELAPDRTASSQRASKPEFRDQQADGRGPPPGLRGPPQEAIAACSTLEPGTVCRFTSARGDLIAGTCRAPAGTRACVPDRR